MFIITRAVAPIVPEVSVFLTAIHQQGGARRGGGGGWGAENQFHLRISLIKQ